MSHQLRQAEARKIKYGLLPDEDELDMETLWKDKSRNWHNRIQNISTRTSMKDLHNCNECGHNVSWNCYFRDFHFAYCTAIVRNNEGELDFCGEYFMVTSPRGCEKHQFKHGHNKDYQVAGKKGTAGLVQPTIPTEEEYIRMRAYGFVSVHELRVKEAKDQAEAARVAEEARNRQTEDPAAAEEEVEDLQPWMRYSKKPMFSNKPGPRARTKNSQGLKAQPAPFVNDHFKEVEKQKEIAKRKEPRPNYRNADNDFGVENDRTVEKTREVKEPHTVKPTKVKKNLITRGAVWVFGDRDVEKAEKKAAKKVTKEAAKDKENQAPE